MNATSSLPTWSWPDSLDALTAAPDYHAVMLENEEVRVLDTRIPPGHTVPLHTHRWPSVLYILSWSDCVRRDEEGKVTLDSRATGRVPPKVVWSAELPPHTLENVGNSDIHVISVELKRAAESPR